MGYYSQRNRKLIPDYLPRSLRVIIYWVFGLAVLLILVGFIGFFGSISKTFLNFDLTLNENFFGTLVNTIKTGAIFWGIILSGFILWFVAILAVIVTANLYYPKPSSTSRKRPPKEHRLYFPKIQEVQDPNLRQSLIAAVKNLNIENVDMGMFYLGKIFEQELKLFLTKAQQVNAFPVSNKDLERLSFMIDCIEKNKIDIVSEKHLLTFLRQERNERAHGQIPDFETRKKMFQQAQFTAGLYIESIVEIHKRKRALS